VQILVTVIETMYLRAVTNTTDMETSTTKSGPKISEYDASSESPYTVQLQSKYIQPSTEHEVVYKADGTMCGIYDIPKGKTILSDNAIYSKLFRGNTEVLMGLSEPAAKMFYYITEFIGANKDEVCILQDDYLQFAGYKAKSRLTYYRGVEGLLRANIIARKTGSQSCYWINPNVLYNGDRTKLKNTVVQPPKDKPFTGFGTK
jgi:hypothetical protein